MKRRSHVILGLGEDIPRHILEDLVLKWYQEDLLTEEEVRVALGLATT